MTNRIVSPHSLSLAIFAVLITHASTGGAVPAVSFGFSETTLSGTANDSTRGWQFGVIAPEGIRVTRIGIYDLFADGLVYAHPVAIWTSTGTLVVTATVPAGTVAPLDENKLFRVIDIPPIHLPPGTYIIGGLYSPTLGEEFQRFSVPDFVVAPQIAYQFPRYLSQSSPILMFPTEILGGGPSIFGPSFEFEPESATVVLPVPGPSPFLLALGMMVVVLYALWRRSKS